MNCSRGSQTVTSTCNDNGLFLHNARCRACTLLHAGPLCTSPPVPDPFAPLMRLIKTHAEDMPLHMCNMYAHFPTCRCLPPSLRLHACQSCISAGHNHEKRVACMQNPASLVGCFAAPRHAWPCCASSSQSFSKRVLDCSLASKFSSQILAARLHTRTFHAAAQTSQPLALL